MNQCDLFDVGIDDTSCEPVIPGTGTKAYLFLVDECFQASFPQVQPGTNEYNWSDFLATDGGNAGITNKLYAVKIKPRSGHPTGSREDGKKVATQVLECMIDGDIDKFHALEAVLPYKNIGVLISDNAGKFYVFMSPYQQPTLATNFEGGTDVSSDMGTTFTLNYVSRYLSCKIDPAGANLDSFLASRVGGSETSSVTITSPTNGSLTVSLGGKVINSGDKVLNGSTIRIVAKPASTGYRLNYVTVNGNRKVAEDFTYVVSGNTTISAAFETNS